MKTWVFLGFILISGVTMHQAQAQSCTLYGSKIFSDDSLHIECANWSLQNSANATIAKDKRLRIDGTVIVQDQARLKVESGAVLFIYGDLKLSENAKLDLSGQLKVFGNILVSGKAEACGDGVAEVSGVVSGYGWCFDINTKPMEPIALKAMLTDGGVELSWRSQIQMDGDYILERSMNGMTFTELAREEVERANEEVSFTDAGLDPGTYYFRLKQSNGDMQEYASKVIAITIQDSKKKGCELVVDPNPCVPSCDIILSDCPGSTFRTYLLDGAGRTVSELIPISENKGTIQYHLNKDNFMMPGVYIIQTSSDSSSAAKKVMVK